MKEIEEEFLICIGKRLYNTCDIINTNTNIIFYETKKTEKKSIYVMADNFKRTKIGVSINPKNRSKQLEGATGLDINVEYKTIQCYNWSKIESKMHYIFKNKRIKSEWFNVEIEDVIKELKRQSFDTRDYIRTGKKTEYTYKQLDRINKMKDRIDIAGIDDFLLNCSKEDLIKKIHELMLEYKDDKEDSFDLIQELIEYINVYFNVFNENQIKYNSYTITNEKQHNYYPVVYFDDFIDRNGNKCVDEKGLGIDIFITAWKDRI